MRNLMKIQIDKSALIAIAQTKLLVGEIPHGSRITDLYYNKDEDVFEAVIQHPDFQLVKEGEETPLFTNVKFTSARWHENMNRSKKQNENK